MFRIPTIKTTTTNPHIELEAALNSAISTATKAGIAPDQIIDALSAHIVSLTRQNLAREDRQRSNPRVYDGNGQPIDLDAQIARAEAIREEKRQTESRKAYAADVARRAAREDFLP